MTDKNEYSDIVTEFLDPTPAEARPNVQAGLALAADKKPDYEAELIRLSAKTGVPLDTARNMPDEVRRQAFVIDANPGLIETQYPKVADFLSLPENAAVSSDDIGVMQNVSNLWASLVTGASRGAVQDQLGPLHYRALVGDISPSQESERQRLKQVMQAYGRDASRETGFGYFLNQTGYSGRQLVSSIREGATGALAGAATGASAAAIAGQLGPQVALPEELVTVPAGALLGARLGYVSGSVVYNYQQEAGFAFDEFSDMVDEATGQKLDQATARGAAAAVGLVNAGLETVGDLAMAKLIPGLDRLLSQGGKGVVKQLLARPTFRSAIAQAGTRWVRVATTEGLTEAMQEVVNIIGGELAQGVGGIDSDTGDLGDMVDRVRQAGQDAFVGALGVGAAPSAYQGYRDVRRAQAAQQNQEFMQALGEAANDSKLRQRLPEKWREFIAKAKEGGPVDNVYIPAEQFARYFQSAGVDPAEVAAEIGARNYAEAVEAGTDVVIPIEDYATFIAPTEHHAALMQDARLHPGDMTPREAAAFEAERDQRMREIAETLEEQIEGRFDSEFNTVRNAMLGELVNRFDRRTAEAYAELYARGITTMATRAGIDPRDLHERYGLSVAVQLPEVLRPGGESDIQIDPLLDRLRAGDIPTEDQVFGVRLSDFIRSRGGITDDHLTGELRDVDENDPRAPGRLKLVQSQGGLSIDYMREAAAEAGYLPMESTEADFLALLDEDLRGNPVYLPGAEDSTLLNLRDTLNTIDEWLRDNGIDLAEMSNEQVRQALERAGEYQRPDTQRLEQAALPETIDVDGTARPTVNSEGRPIAANEEAVRAFWRWFGDSKVVDDQGRPQIVYHGTNQDFSAFDESRIGENTTAASSIAFFFTDTPAEASEYSMLAGRTQLADAVNVEARSAEIQAQIQRAENRGDWDTAERLYLELENLELGAINDDPSGQNVIPVYLKVESPKTLDMGDAFDGHRVAGEIRKAKRSKKADGLRLDNAYDPVDADRGGFSTTQWVAFDPEQIKSAIGNRGTFDPSDARILFQSGRERDDYTLDLFGVPAEEGTNAVAERGAAGRSERRLSRDDAPGTFAARTEVVEENKRKLGTQKVTNVEEAAQALAYLGRGAVERFDALVTDKNGKPLAIVGATKGALSQASVFPSTVVAEAFRINGAANIWFAHNHPSGSNSFSDADRQMNEMLTEAFRGSEIAPRGIFAIAGKAGQGEGRNWVFMPPGSRRNTTSDERGVSTAPSKTKNVPVVERLYTDEGRLGPKIDSPAAAIKNARTISGGESGVVLMTAQLEPVAFVPVDPVEAGELRRDGRMDSLYRALSVANAGAAIIVNNGNMNDATVSNLAGLFNSIDARVLDVMEISGETVTSWANTGKSFRGNTFRQSERGFIEFGSDRKFRITLLDGADLSTFLHETGHFWLEVLGDLAQADGAAQQITDDYKTILDWFSVESRDQIETKHHEQFARGFEAYLMEGRAPSPALRSIFQRFKAWLTLIYRRLAALDVNLTPQVRGVFDRILAADEEIQAAQDEAGMTAIFATAADAGMTDVEFEAYRKTVEAAGETAREDLQQKLMAEYQRAQKQWWKEQRRKVLDEVAEEVSALPVYQAFDSLVVGRLPDGQPIKLNKDDLVERYGAEYVKRLPRGRSWVYAVEGGWPADLAAEALGFPSADSLVEALVNMRPKRAVIEAETDVRMRERHGDMMLDGSIHEQAVDAVHNEQRANVLAAELRALRRREREVRPFLRAAEQARTQGRADMQASIAPVEAFRAAAAGMIGQKQVRDLDPNSYLLAERRASREAFDAASRGDWQVAAAAKQRELMNHYLYREAVKARREIEAIRKYADGLSKPAAQQRIGKAKGGYLDQVNALLEQYEFKKVSGRQIDRRKNLLAWYDQQVAAGYNPAITPELLEQAGQRNYLEVPVDELRAVRDALKSIEHLARLKNRLLLKNQQIEFEDAIGQLVGSAMANTKGVPQRSIDRALRTRRQAIGDWFRGHDADLLPLETVIDWLDGGRADGPWHRYIFNRASDAQTAELDIMGRLGEKIGKLLEDFHLDNKTYLLEQFTFPAVGNVSRHWLISMALNVGNESNYDKLLRGNQLTAADVDLMLGKLSSDDWQFVQSVWDTVNELWPEIAALEERVSGVAPEQIEARPFQIKDADGNVLHEVKGGYYPLAYDPKFSQAGQRQESGPLAGLVEQGYAQATSPKGHTKARTDFAAPLLLDFGFVLQRHLAGVVKDLTHREFLIDANRIINNAEIRRTLQTQLGDQYEQMFMPWLRAVANDRNVSPSDGLTGLDRMIESARTNATTVALGYKVTTIFAQLAGAFNAAEIVGTKWLYSGLMESLRNPRAAYQMVVEKSGEMRHRFETIDRDVRDELRAMRQGKVAKWHSAVNRGAFIGINIADRMVTIPTWVGSYNKALAEGMAEAEAIHQADAAVRRSQGAGGAKDLSAVQRKRGAIKMLTMFYTPFAAQYGRLRTAQQRLGAEGMRYAPEAIMRVLMITALPAILADLLTSRGPRECGIDDPACYAKWAAIKATFSLSAPIPLLRDVGNLAERMLDGNTPGARDMRVSPVIDALDRVGKTVIKGFDSAFGDRPADESFWFDVMETSGYVVNLPTGQARITIEYLYDLLVGNTSPEGFGELLHDLAFRRKKGE